MNKQKLIKQVADMTASSQPRISTILDAITYTIINELKNNGSVKITNFGRFELFFRHGRRCVHPRKPGEFIKVKGVSTPKFRPSDNFKIIVKDAYKKILEETK